MDNKRCLVCNLALEKSRKYKGLLICNGCGFLTADLKISDAELEKLYGKHYFEDGEYKDYKSEKVALQLNFNKRINHIKSLPNVNGSSKVFEIGCAHGFFLDLLKQHSLEASGIDISKEAVQYAINSCDVDAHYGNFLKFTPKFSPDIICLWDAIEHIGNPRKYLEHANNISASGSYILITTGDIASLNARIRGPKWRMIHPPTHLHYFTKHSMVTLLNDVGYENITFLYTPVWRTIGSILNAVIYKKFKAERIKSWIDKIPGAGLPVPLNLFDIMLVTAQKKN